MLPPGARCGTSESVSVGSGVVPLLPTEGLGDLDGAEQCLEESIRVARDSGRSYELALSLEALGRLPGHAGSEGTSEAEEARGIFQTLGVVSTPKVPLRLP